uniref:Uncharacterized protein n=1 Tax=Arion vulgaris TaxID=1028688 RepID=A0A0B7BSJ0_9EUPU
MAGTKSIRTITLTEKALALSYGADDIFNDEDSRDDDIFSLSESVHSDSENSVQVRDTDNENSDTHECDLRPASVLELTLSQLRRKY